MNRNIFFYDDEKIASVCFNYFERCFDNASTENTFNALKLISFQQAKSLDLINCDANMHILIPTKKSVENCIEIIRKAFKLGKYPGRIYGRCMYCGTELILENTNIVVEKTDTHKIIAEKLLAYHYENETKFHCETIDMLNFSIISFLQSNFSIE